MVLNITNEANAIIRYKGVSIKDIEASFEAYLYFKNVYKEHMIEDNFNTGLPLVTVSLLDYRDIDDYLGNMFRGTEVDENNFFYKMMFLLERIDTYTNSTDVYDVEVKHVPNGYMLTINSRGNVLELRYLDLLKIYRKGFKVE